MTSKKQTKANQANSKKSTGAKTPEGKAAVSTNAVKHGIFSTKAVLPHECESEYQDLLTDLQESLNPVGKMEEVLVDKIALAMWRQVRLVKAETAFIHTRTSLDFPAMRSAVHSASNDSGYMKPSQDYFQPLNKDDLEQIAWCKNVIAEIGSLDSYHTASLDDVRPLKDTWGQVERDAEGEAIEVYIASYQGSWGSGLSGYLSDLKKWCEDELTRLQTRQECIDIVPVIQDSRSLPINRELMTRYQVTLDNELYKALEAFRKQQEFRFNQPTKKAS
jgi:hypothetical protein